MIRKLFGGFVIPVGCGLLLGLQGCQTGRVTGISFENRVQPPNEFCDSTDPAKLAACTPELKNAIQFAPLQQSVGFVFAGGGTCDEAIVDFGDGDTVKLFQVSSWPHRETHFYSGWGGVKNIRLKGLVNCVGDVTTPLNVGHAPSGRQTYLLAFVPNRSVCNQVPNVRNVRAGSVVRLEANTTKIKYGIPEFDASGDRATTAPSTFAFPNMRPFSLVYKIGSDTFQGEVGRVIIRASQTAPLEICVNDHPAQLGDNLSSGVRIEIGIAEAASVP